ncbi:hypothetical protein [Neomegalonema sp.]|uniref:hypothetical protein n=1 Tax=Neomegalonema sp. TaxID=2039713 RepID=UPI00262FF265|nr:hypothetical protein [Neomegalonema sp.]MDD2869810.1 hypothetical protein [Neomegalonema sp.]
MRVATLALGCGLAFGGAAAQEAPAAEGHGWAASAPAGVIAVGPPQDVELRVSTGPEGEPVSETTAIDLKMGGYYRLNFICTDAADDTAGFRFESPKLLSNAHLRVLSVDDIEIHMQGLSFHALECDEPGAVRFSFHPMRKGEYEFTVKNQDDPPAVLKGVFRVE